MGGWISRKQGVAVATVGRAGVDWLGTAKVKAFALADLGAGDSTMSDLLPQASPDAPANSLDRYRLVLAIDAPLAFPAAFVELLQTGEGRLSLWVAEGATTPSRLASVTVTSIPLHDPTPAFAIPSCGSMKNIVRRMRGWSRSAVPFRAALSRSCSSVGDTGDMLVARTWKPGLATAMARARSRRAAT